MSVNAQPKESKVDVLVIGAGPAGLMCANALGRAGINVRIIDKRPSKVAAGQADGIQPRTIEVLQSYGLAEPLLLAGNQMHLTAFYNPSPAGGIERTNRAYDVTAPTARFGFEVTLHQGEIETIFRDSMRKNGIEVQQSTVPVDLDISDDEKVLGDFSSYPVKVTLKQVIDDSQTTPPWNTSILDLEGLKDGETEIVYAKYVVGCDGAHSWVRNKLNIKLEGESTDYIWGVVDTIPETDFPDIRNRTAIHSNNGSCMVIPREGDKVRLYVQLSEVETDHSGRLNKAKLGPEKVMEVAQKSFLPFKLSFPHKLDWWTLYIIGQRVASKFSVKDRVFIAGDACHTHSPKAGQGMNASMNDTHNLAWKLIYVLRGWAKLSLLHTYEFERRKYAQDLIEFDRKFSALFSGKPRTEKNQDGVSHEEFLRAFQAFGGFTSGIGIRYQPSLIVDERNQSAASKLIVGQRIPPQIVVRSADGRPFELQDLLPSDTRFKILVMTGNTKDPAQRVKLERLAEEIQNPEGIFRKFAPAGGAVNAIFDLLSISNVPKLEVDYTDVPFVFRPHWSKVFTDDETFGGREGGKLYESYGISEDGALVIVRPDGYVGLVAGLEQIQEVKDYLGGFILAIGRSS